MANIVYIAVSLDGYIARSDGDIDWLMEIPNPEASDFGFSEFMGTIDAIIMGRHTYEKVLSFGSWPYDKPVFVLSNSLKDVPGNLAGKLEIISGHPQKIIQVLQGKGFGNLYIDGGKTIRKFLEQELIDEIIITTIPIIIGEGIPLFGNLRASQRFTLVRTEVLNKTLVKSHYRKIIVNDDQL